MRASRVGATLACHRRAGLAGRAVEGLGDALTRLGALPRPGLRARQLRGISARRR